MPTLKQVIDRYLQARRAARYSENTLHDYRNTFRLFLKFTGEDHPFQDIDVNTITQFMASERVARVSKKTALNYHTGLSSLWSWAVENNLAAENIVRKVKPPSPEQREIIPFTRAEVSHLLNACEGGGNVLRDQAILLLLLDTGIRASEMCDLRIRDLNIPERRLLVIGKGRKERILKISKRTLSAIKTYLAERGITNLQYARRNHLFVTKQENPVRRDTIRQLMERLGARAGIPGVHAHRFRHTFAINFLRNGGNIYTLQKFLGHTTLDMVKRYLKIAQTDLDLDHDKASPVANWNL